MKKIFSLMVCCCIAVAAKALTLSGNVKDEKGQIMQYVSVYVQDAKVGATTDLDGNYRIRDLEAGKHTIVVSHVGYGTQTVQIDLTADESRNFEMYEQATTMAELFVTPNGERIERFILNQVVKNTKMLGKRVSSFHCESKSQIEQRDFQGGVVIKPFRKTINFLLGLVGYKKFFSIIFDHPDLKVEMSCNRDFANYALKISDITVSYSNPQLTDEEIKSLTKFFSRRVGNGYDTWYSQMGEIQKQLEKMDKKKPGESVKALKYGGSYEENDETIYILKYGKSEYHIVDGCWQIRRAVQVKKGGDVRSTEFCQLAKGIYMPVSFCDEMHWNFAEVIEDEKKDLAEAKTDKMKEKKLEAHNARVAELEALKDTKFVTKRSGTMNYFTFVLKK